MWHGSAGGVCEYTQLKQYEESVNRSLEQREESVKYNHQNNRNNPDKARIPAVMVGICFYLPPVFGGAFRFHNAVRFQLNRNDNNVVLPTEVLNDLTYNDINGENRVLEQVFHPNGIGIQENAISLYKQIIEAMIRSIPNPPMDREDVARFRRNLEKHLRGNFSAEERHRIEERKARTEANVKRIIRNCGGKNPLLGY